MVLDYALPRPDYGVQHRFGKLGARHGCVSQRDLDRAAAARRLRLDPRLVVADDDEQAPLGSRMLDRDSHQRLDELGEIDLARHSLRALDHRFEVQLLDGRLFFNDTATSEIFPLPLLDALPNSSMYSNPAR